MYGCYNIYDNTFLWMTKIWSSHTCTSATKCKCCTLESSVSASCTLIQYITHNVDRGTQVLQSFACFYDFLKFVSFVVFWLECAFGNSLPAARRMGMYAYVVPSLRIKYWTDAVEDCKDFHSHSVLRNSYLLLVRTLWRDNLFMVSRDTMIGVIS